MSVYMVDIDNTICISKGSDYANSEPITNRIKQVNELYDAGHKIIYWTARGGNSGIDWTDTTHNQLAAWGCKYNEIRMGKPVYDIWIDDKAINSDDFFK
jgi:prolyl oligopeptidase PreP (S9A serine peptidase family)